MKQQHLLRALFLGFLMALCSPVFAQNTGSVNQIIANQNDHYKYSAYYLLNNYEKALYDAVYSSIANAERIIYLPRNVFREDIIESESLLNAMMAMRMDHAEFVWLEPDYNYAISHNDYGQITEIKLEMNYNALASNAKYHQREFLAAAERVLKYARQHKIQLEQQRYVYDYLVSEVTYNDHDLDQTAYAALVMKNSVCAGYALAYNFLMKQLGIPSYYQRGEHHAWALTYMNGQWLHVDPTAPTGKIESREALARFEDKYFNQPIGSPYIKTPDRNDFPNSRMPI